MKNSILFFCALFMISCNGDSQQLGDESFNPIVSNPVYPNGNGSIVFIDEAHFNYHTLNVRYKPFATVLEKDGYVLQSSKEPFSREQLEKCKILVIANALDSSNLDEWSLPTPSAFTEEEIEAVNSWVKEGGSLFLIADHMPFPGAAEKLASSFAFKFYNGYATKEHGDDDTFTFKNGLKECKLTMGRNKKEKVTSLQTFIGQAFEIPNEATPIIVLDSRFSIILPQKAWEIHENINRISAENMVQGAYMNYGKGKLVVFGEAAMFTAQTAGKKKIGLNKKSASQNLQFLLNTVHWLDGIIE